MPTPEVIKVTDPIVPGSIVVVRQKDIVDWNEDDPANGYLYAQACAGLVVELQRAAGHSQFCMLVVDVDDLAEGIGGARVFGPDDLVAAIQATVTR